MGWGNADAGVERTVQRVVLLAAAALAVGCGSDGRARTTAQGGGITAGGSGASESGATDGDHSGGSDSSPGSGGSGDDGARFDVGGGDTDGLPDGGCNGEGGGGGPGELELSYIWIANSAQGTISKIDTQTIVEEGRYQSHPAVGDPSRTSVNLNGDVAVANRNGGVAKFWANAEECADTNGQPGIQTSSGAQDVLGWGDDECLAWYLELDCSSNRPVAWTRGEWSANACAYVDAQLWTVCDSRVLLLDGETGSIVHEETLPNASAFVYGGAADADGNFWGIDLASNQLVRVDIDTFVIQTWALPPAGGYGITVGPEGRPWVCGGGGVSRFNLDTETWDSAGGSGIGGCMTDGDSLIWHSDPDGTLLGYDIETLQVQQQVQLPEYVHGVSVDHHGYVWGVGFSNSNAYRADPVTGDVQTYSGLVGAYTYSDMTGFALKTAGGAPPEG
jgi:hypothetical protein